MAAKPKVVVARETFSAEVDGVTVIVHAGQTRVSSTHPLAKAHPHLFEPTDAVDELGAKQP